MLIDSKDVARDSVLATSVCIIGAGAAGLTLALELAAQSIDVIVLEAGDEESRRTPPTHFSAHVADPRHPPATLYRKQTLGGGTTVWGGRCVPFDAIDFAPRPYMQFSGWPFDRAALMPYYIRAQKLLEAGDFDYAVESALTGPFVDAFAPTRIVETMERFSTPTNMWRRYRSSLVKHRNVRVVQNARCVGFSISQTGNALDAAYVSGRGGIFKIRASYFIAAVGGLETVRLLGRNAFHSNLPMLGRTYMCHLEAAPATLRLTPATRPVQYGFERTRDGVYARRRFALSQSEQLSKQILNAVVRLHHANVVDPAHEDPILSAMFVTKRLLIPEYARKFSVIEHASGAEHRYSANLWAKHVRNILFGMPRLASFSGSWLLDRHVRRRRIPYVALRSAVGEYALDVNSEQEPTMESRVSLSDDLDEHGVPLLNIDWRPSELDIRTISENVRELNSTLIDAGVGRLSFNDAELDDICRETAVPVGGHHIGTARMAASSREGVVDANCRVHGLQNLFVAGSAVFPTSSHANPTLTIVALAARLSDHIVKLGTPNRAQAA